MPVTLLDKSLQVKTDHAAPMQWIPYVLKLRGIALEYCADRAEDRIEGGQLAFQVSNRLGRLLYTVN